MALLKLILSALFDALADHARDWAERPIAKAPDALADVPRHADWKARIIADANARARHDQP